VPGALVRGAALQQRDEALVRVGDALAAHRGVDARDQLGLSAVQQALGLVGHRGEVGPHPRGELVQHIVMKFREEFASHGRRSAG
jgi:hypothetical protein